MFDNLTAFKPDFYYFYLFGYNVVINTVYKKFEIICLLKTFVSNVTNARNLKKTYVMTSWFLIVLILILMSILWKMKKWMYNPFFFDFVWKFEILLLFLQKIIKL